MRALLVCGFWLTAATVHATTIVNLSDPSGLSAKATFDLLNPTTLQIALQNTSTGLPLGFSNSDQLLTSLSFDLGAADILGGSAAIGSASAAVNFDAGAFGPGADVGGEWGYGNGGTTGLLANFVSSNTAGAVALGGANLDGPGELDGPQGGLVANPILEPLGGLGAIQDEVVFTLTLSQPLSDLSFLNNGVIAEFGSDAAFIVPEPGVVSLLVVGLLAAAGRRRRS